MSALPPKADIADAMWNARFVPKADILRCKKMSLFDHLVGAEDKRLRKGDAERFCGLEI
jgi:hypothetical protein